MRWFCLLLLAACASTAPEYEGAVDVQTHFRGSEGFGMARATEATRAALRHRNWTVLSNADAAHRFESDAHGVTMEWLHASELRLMAGGRVNYFKGARDAWRWLQATGGGKGQPARIRRLAYRLYNHNAAGYASSVDWKRGSDRAGNTDVYFVREGIAQQKFARIVPSYIVSTEEYRDRIETSGAGGPVMATFPRTAARDKKWPYLYPDLYCAPLCAVLDFDQGEARLTLRDSVDGESVSLFGRTVPLKFDFTAPWAYAIKFQKTDLKAEQSEGLKNPDTKFQAVYMLQPPDNRRRLALFVHGLNSSPQVFRQLANALGRDPKIRANYQFVAYRYATGYSLFFNNVLFRERLREFYDYLQRAAPRSYAAGTVAIGHSMGGLLTKSLAQDSGTELWNRIFQRPPARVTVDTPEGRFLKNALVYKPLPEIRRLIFMAAPHRGSKLATGVIAEIGKASISQDPRVEQIKSRVLERFRDDLRPNMEQRLTTPLTSVDSLRPDDLYLNILNRFPLRVAFHSIVGDMAGSQDDPKGDSVVPYSSAHLDGAQSELIVKWGHNLPACPDAQKEVQRILLLHLK